MGTAPNILPTGPDTQFHLVPGSHSQPAVNPNYFFISFDNGPPFESSPFGDGFYLLVQRLLPVLRIYFNLQ